MIYMVLAFDDDDFATERADTPKEREKLISKGVSWDSPVTTVEVEARALEKGLSLSELERLGIL